MVVLSSPLIFLQRSQIANLALKSRLPTINLFNSFPRFGGLMAYVLTARDRCTPSACRAFRSLTETRQITANMEDRVYESLIMRHASSWNAPQAATGMVAALPPSVPTGKPTNAEFPTSASTPPVNIMTPAMTIAASILLIFLSIEQYLTMSRANEKGPD